MLTKIRQRFMNGLTTGIARPQATQRPHDGVYPLRRIAQLRVDLGELAHECIALARTRFHLSEDALSYEERTAGPAVVIGDADELKAAVLNLIDNAVKYSASDPRVSVKLEETADHSRYALKVSDRGAGISPHELKRVFRRFYRIHGMSVRTKGSGLGLFISKSYAGLMGGSLRLESEPGRGTAALLLLRVPARGELGP